MKRKITWITKLVIIGSFITLPSICYAQYETDTVVSDINVVAPEESFRENKFDAFDHDSMTTEVRSVPDSVVKKLQSDEAFWYANESFKKKVADSPNRSYRKPLTAQKWFKTLMWTIIIVAFLAAVIWYLSASNFKFFGRRSEKVKVGDEEAETEDIFGIQYQREIARAEQANNFRLAIRLHFLQLLKTLSEKDIIRYQQDRTNFDYLMQLSNGGYYKDFFRLVRNYEYAWYGKMDPGAEGYAIIKKDFEQINSRLT